MNTSRRLAWIIVLAIECLLGRAPKTFPVKSAGSRVTVDCTVLGEYPSNVVRIELTDTIAREAVWDVASQGRPMKIHSITVVAGSNPCRPTDSPVNLVRCGAGAIDEAFDLQIGVPYRLRVWSNSVDRPAVDEEFIFTAPEISDKR